MSPRRGTWVPSDREEAMSEIGKKAAFIALGLLAALVLAIIAWVVVWRFWGLR